MVNYEFASFVASNFYDWLKVFKTNEKILS